MTAAAAALPRRARGHRRGTDGNSAPIIPKETLDAVLLDRRTGRRRRRFQTISPTRSRFDVSSHPRSQNIFFTFTMGGASSKHSIEKIDFSVAPVSRLHEIALLPSAERGEIAQICKVKPSAVRATCKGGYTPLALAVYRSGTNSENITELLRQGSDANTGKGGDGLVLAWAARTGKVDVVRCRPAIIQV